MKTLLGSFRSLKDRMFLGALGMLITMTGLVIVIAFATGCATERISHQRYQPGFPFNGGAMDQPQAQTQVQPQQIQPQSVPVPQPNPLARNQQTGQPNCVVAQPVTLMTEDLKIERKGWGVGRYPSPPVWQGQSQQQCQPTYGIGGAVGYNTPPPVYGGTPGCYGGGRPSYSYSGW